ncbi:MAG: hypothetical protein HXX18_09195 [Bacteroidetes bacterium]|nr:hypothetical protein [Bacteroidota bacterium]
MKLKNLLLIVLTSSLLFSNLSAQNFDFRSTKWGMDSLQVRKSEKTKFVYSKKNTLVYAGKIADMEAKIIYNFNSSNQLFRAFYNIALSNKDSKNPTNSVNAYLMFQDLLTTKYSEPFSKRSSTINGKELKQEEWASNLISDNLTLETKWKNENTEITLTLFSINDELFIEIIYATLNKNIKENENYKQQIIKEL